MAPSDGATDWSDDFVKSGGQYAPAITVDQQGGVINAGYFIHYMTYHYPTGDQGNTWKGSFDIMIARHFR
jgi:hypothetical protein